MTDKGKSPIPSSDGETTVTFKKHNDVTTGVPAAQLITTSARHKDTTPVAESGQSANNKFEDPPDKKQKKKRTRAKKPKDMPRRPLSAYNLFFRSAKSRIQAAAGKDKLGFEELGKRIGALWKQIDQEEKKVFEDQAKVEMDRYKKEMEVYQNEIAQKAQFQSSTFIRQNIDDGGPTQVKWSKCELWDATWEPTVGGIKDCIDQGLQGIGIASQQVYPLAMAGMQSPAFSQQDFQLTQQQLSLPQHSQNPWSAGLFTDSFPSETVQNQGQFQFQAQHFDQTGSNVSSGAASIRPAMGHQFAPISHASFPSDPMQYYTTTGSLFPNQANQQEQRTDIMFPGGIFQQGQIAPANDATFLQQQQQSTPSQLMPAMSSGTFATQSTGTTPVPINFDAALYHALGQSSSSDGVTPPFPAPNNKDE